MFKYIILFYLITLTLPLLAQDKKGFEPEFNLSETTLVSSGKDLPFWMTSNQNGLITLHNKNYILLQAGIRRSLDRDSLKNWGYTYGANMAYGLGGGSDFHPNEYWLGVRYHSLIFNAGTRADPIIYGGLSSTNGNMDHSGNARPVPGFAISSSRYLPFLFAKRWFSFRFIYEEGILTDKQAVTNAHLHHKNIYFKSQLSQSLTLTIGLEHYVFWGGTSSVNGPQPGWSDYFRYVLEMKGSHHATGSDQINAAGSGLGIYNVVLKKDWSTLVASFYWNHPFEDRSGLELENLRDGIWGIHLGKKSQDAFVTDFVYEYMYTLNQSGRGYRGRDSYFNNGEYSSGFTYFQRMMGTPLFVPTIGADGISRGFESTRMWMHHLGVGGKLGSSLSWKSLFTFSRNFGSYNDIYPKPLDEFSILVEGSYITSKLPFALKAGVAGDYGGRFEHRVGGYLGIGFHF